MSHDNGRPRCAYTVQQLIDLYLPQARREVCKESMESKEHVLGKFAAVHGAATPETLRPFDLQKFINDWPELRSEWTIRGVVSTIKRLFNWCLEMELIDRNPFGRFRRRGKVVSKRKPMADEDFQTLMRFSAPVFRRFLIFLKCSGCRPGEASAMRWDQVDFAQRCVKLTEHKTAGSTGQARIIPLVSTTIRMLVWMKRRRQVSTIGLLEKLLKNGPVKGVELVRYLSHYGISDRGVYVARQAMGVIRERVGGRSPKGYWSYRLPTDYVFSGEPPEQEYVFSTCLGNPLTKYSLNCWMRRVRKRSGLPTGVSCYQLRHRFGFQGAKNNVSLKLLSLAMGHTKTTMTEHYINNAGLMAEVQRAAAQVVFGEGAVEVGKDRIAALKENMAALVAPGATPTREQIAAVKSQIEALLVPTCTPPPVDHMPATLEQLPDRFGSPRPRPEVRAGVADVPLPSPTADPAEQSVDAMLRHLMSRVGARKPVYRKPTSTKETLAPTHDQAYQALAWAVGIDPQFATATDAKTYEWLLTRADCPFKLPPTFAAFSRYVTSARHFHGTLKRVGPGRPPLRRHGEAAGGQ